MPQELTAESAVAALIATRRADSAARLATSIKRRGELAAVVNAGLVPEGNARYDWILAAAAALRDTLAVEALCFNESSPDDCISTLDMIDVLNTLKAQLVAVSRREIV